MKCDTNPCPERSQGRNEPYCDCQWGSANMSVQTCTFCKTCLDDLWERINPLLQLNLAWFRMGPPGSIKGEKRDNDTAA